MDYGWLNIGSLLFGLIALILPVIHLIQNKESINGSWGVFSVVSVGACAISLCMQILYINHLVIIEDWSAMMDTLNTVALVSVLLLVITIILNAITYFLYSRRKS